MFKLLNGDDAPRIRIADTHDEIWDLAEFRGKMVVLHFGRGEY